MSSLFHSVSEIPTTHRERTVDHCPTRKIDCSAMAELCRPEEDDVDDRVDSAIPAPIEEEQITRPYPSNVYAEMMMDANRSAAQATPETRSQQMPIRRVTLPGMRSAHSNLMELVVVIAGAIALPVITLATFQSFADVPSTTVLAAAPVAQAKEVQTLKVPDSERSMVASARTHSDSTATSGAVPAKSQPSNPTPERLQGTEVKSTKRVSVPASVGHHSASGKASIKPVSLKLRPQSYEIED